MKMEQEFEVAAPIDEVWRALIDVERVAPCLPGARITERGEDGSYKGTFEVRIGPTKAAYNGTLKIAEADEAAHRAVLDARGTDKRGQGGASATIVNTLSESGGGTRVHADTDFTITGRLARFSRSGMIEDISNRLLREFADCLQAQLASSPAAAGGVEAGGAGAAVAAAGGVEAGAAGAAAAAAADTAAATSTGTAAASTPGDGSAADEAGGGATRAAGAVPPRPAAPPRPASAPPPPQAKPVNGLALFFGVLYERLARLFGRKGRGRDRR